jgi:hypothetical protein
VDTILDVHIASLTCNYTFVQTARGVRLLINNVAIYLSCDLSQNLGFLFFVAHRCCMVTKQTQDKAANVVLREMLERCEADVEIESMHGTAPKH